MIRILFDVASLTSVLVLLTLGLGLIAGMMGIFNLAHGEFVLLGALTAYYVTVFGWSPWTGVVLAPIVVGFLGAVVEFTVVRRLYARPLHAILATWAIAIAIRGAVTRALRTTARSVPYPVSGTVELFGTQVSLWRIVVLLVTPVLVLGLYLLLRRTDFGLRVRAAIEAPELARLSRINTSRLYALTFTMGAALAGLGGAMVAPLSSVYPTLGVGYLVDSFLALMIGGLGSVEAAVIGAGTVGMTSGLVRYVVSPALSGAVVLALSVAVMRLRPQRSDLR